MADVEQQKGQNEQGQEQANTSAVTLLQGAATKPTNEQLAVQKPELGFWDQLWMDWFSWDSWILAAYRGRINFRSFCDAKSQAITNTFKDEVMLKHREPLLRAIKHNSKGESYNLQAFLYMFSMLCVFLIATSSGFVISNIFGAHLNTYIGLSGAAATALKYGLASVTFTGVFLSCWMTFRTIVPDVIRKFFETSGKLRWQFISPNSLAIYRNHEMKIKAGYEHEEAEDGQKKYKNDPRQDRRFNWVEYLILFVQFCLSTIVGLAILAQTVIKSQGGMTGLLPFLIGTPIPLYLAWIMGVAAFCCMLGQYTSTTMDLLRNPKKLFSVFSMFRQVKPDRSDVFEVYLHNALMAVFCGALLFFVVVGMIGTSKVQAKNFLDMFSLARSKENKWVVTALSMAGKLFFTLRALGNIVCLGCATLVSQFYKWVKGVDKPATVLRNSDEALPWWGLPAAIIFTITKAFTAVDPPVEAEPGHVDIGVPDQDLSTPDHEPLNYDELTALPEHEKPVSKLFSPNFDQKFMAGSAIAGAGIRCLQEPLSGVKPNEELLPNPQQEPKKVAVVQQTA